MKWIGSGPGESGAFTRTSRCAAPHACRIENRAPVNRGVLVDAGGTRALDALRHAASHAARRERVAGEKGWRTSLDLCQRRLKVAHFRRAKMAHFVDG